MWRQHLLAGRYCTTTSDSQQPSPAIISTFTMSISHTHGQYTHQLINCKPMTDAQQCSLSTGMPSLLSGQPVFWPYRHAAP